MIAHLTPNSFVRSSCPPNTASATAMRIESFGKQLYQYGGHKITHNSLWRTEDDTTGSYSIHGTVAENGIYGAYRVRLFERSSARCIRETWSTNEGVYLFEYIANIGYFITVHNHHNKEALIVDFVTPEEM